MANTSIRRVLVLGGSRFLGTAVAQQFIDRGMAVSILIAPGQLDDGFADSRVARRVQATGGRTADTARVRQIIAQHEIDLIVQCETGDFPEQSHVLTRGVLTAAATSERKPAVLVPLRREEAACRPRFESVAGLGLSVAFVKLPEVWGAGDEDLSRWSASQFARAVLDWPLTSPLRPFEVLHVDQAAAALAAAAETLPEIGSHGQMPTVPGEGTCRDLLAALRDEVGPRLHGGAVPMQETVLQVLSWYRDRADLWRGRLQAAATRAAA